MGRGNHLRSILMPMLHRKDKESRQKIWYFQNIYLLLPTSNNPLVTMKRREDYIELIEAHADELRTDFGIKSLRLFGSVSRGEHTPTSDVDVCVEMEPKMLLLARLKRFLENLLQCSVDVIRVHKHMNPFLLKEIEHDGIYLIK
jgi:uncharacterized protein